MLWAGEGRRRKDAELAGVSARTVDRTKTRYAEHGLAGLVEKKRGGRKDQVPPQTRGQVIAMKSRVAVESVPSGRSGPPGNGGSLRRAAPWAAGCAVANRTPGREAYPFGHLPTPSTVVASAFKAAWTVRPGVFRTSTGRTAAGRDRPSTRVSPCPLLRRHEPGLAMRPWVAPLGALTGAEAEDYRTGRKRTPLADVAPAGTATACHRGPRPRGTRWQHRSDHRGHPPARSRGRGVSLGPPGPSVPADRG
ncbi:helix-turn-helix domain-containing protein [Streptomyces sp. CA-135486]|uniref:helix-turn-helix domain-containing protein n=1 Tax=Streptomyces sp. CA-135486 TaxID=3240049 RepID=UPI003D8C8CF1